MDAAFAPLVDLTIAVHSQTRPIARAVGAVLRGTNAPVRVTVVAHNIDQTIIEHNLGALMDDRRVRVLSLRDGIPSPAGPMNLGLAHATAPFIAVAGSDDELAAGAIDSWLACQARTAADVVLARIQLPDGRTDPYPPVRWGRRTQRLHVRKDRLHYRSAPLGLIRRATHGDLRFTEGLKSGEDLAYTGALWFTSTAISYDLHGPAYVGHDDAVDRVTSEVRLVAEDFAFLDAVEQAPWFAHLSRRDRDALVLKYLRLHVFDAVQSRATSDETYRAHAAALRALIARLRDWSPGAFSLLSRADHAVIREIDSAADSVARLAPLLARRQRYGSPRTLITANPFLLMHRQAPLRTFAAGYLVMHRH